VPDVCEVLLGDVVEDAAAAHLDSGVGPAAAAAFARGSTGSGGEHDRLAGLAGCT
jgi:hypothetical protein